MKRLLLGILVLCFIGISSAQAQVMSDYCSTPPFIGTVLKPNVLVILDNSNSMDEDFYGNAAGSFNSTDKLVIGKKALRDIITRFKDKLRLGVASFKIGSGVSALYIHNSPYFASYQVKSYCPNPPPECVDWCQTNNTGSKATCTAACQAQNAAFDPDYFDEIITANGVGSPTRNKYCGLLYPKTNVGVPDPINYPGISLYYKQALPFYDNPQPTAHCYSPGYSTQECGGTNVGPWNSYSCWTQKTDSSDVGTGYNGTNIYNGGLSPTDSDVAAGYLNFGRRLSWYPVGPTWFKNSSDGNGYIHVNVDDLVDTSGSNTITFTNVMAKLDPKEGDQTGYMSCGNSDKDSCPYIIAAGLTPTAGTFQTAINYFQGVSSPIQYGCQTNYVIFVTDGLPSVNESGGEDTADNLKPAVISKINALRAATKTLGSTNYTFDIKSYILGVGLTPDAKLMLDDMAKAGGADNGGHAYYADDPTAMSNALTQIFEDIASRVSSGTAASVLASSEGSGANMLQAVFYPKRFIEGGTEATWTGELLNLWYYIDPQLNSSTIREDTVKGSTPDTLRTLNLIDDHVVYFDFDPVTNATSVRRLADSTGHGPYTLVDSSVPIEKLNYLWAAGKSLFLKSASSRHIKYGKKSGSAWILDDFVIGNFPSPDDAVFNNTFTGDPTTTQIIDYVSGTDNAAFRNRTVTIDGVTGVWKLGDIVSSTPRIQSSFPLNYYHLPPADGYNDRTYLSFINTSLYKGRGMVYAGANDGMLHAFNLGKLEYLNNGAEVAKLSTTAGNPFGEEKWAYIPRNALPYLKYLLSKNYCHLFYVDLPPTLIDASINGDPGDTKTAASWKTILIGGMGLGGACQERTTVCNDISSPQNCVNIPKDNIGYSSYFALDITDQDNPVLLWEFNDPALGFSTSGPAIVRVGDKNKNGKWMAVFASGPTGPIDTSSFHQFMGKSDQKLKLFVRDLYTGADLGTIDTGITNAFGGSLYNATIDLERGTPTNPSNYQDDALYVGYTTDHYGGDTDTTWSKGGVLRILTNNSATVSGWSPPSTLIDGIGPVTSAVTKLHDSSKGNLWLYFGTGRFYYRRGVDIDDKATQQRLYGIKDPCYSKMISHTTCSESALSGTGELINQTTINSTTGDHGWYIDLGLTQTTAGIEYGAERVITDPLAIFSGTVFFTTFMPAADACSLGGNTALWAVKYDSGGAVSLQGEALMQISTGEIIQLGLDTITNRRSADFKGMPPRGQGLAVLVKPKPLRKVLQMKEK